MLVSFEKQHGVNNVFKDLGTGKRSILGDMTDEKYRGRRFLGIFHQLPAHSLICEMLPGDDSRASS